MSNACQIKPISAALFELPKPGSIEEHMFVNGLVCIKLKSIEELRGMMYAPSIPIPLRQANPNGFISINCEERYERRISE